MNELLTEIESLAQRLGHGMVEPSAYDTAWVARIPTQEDPDLPAFPESLDWLRRHQLSDGSWGTHFPFNAQSNLLSTLSSLLAFRQWGLPEDQERIQRGLQSLRKVSSMLASERTDTIGFELLLPGLIQEAKGHGWDLPYEEYEIYHSITEEKRKMLKEYQAKYGFTKPDTWWFSLECLGAAGIRENPPNLRADPEHFLQGAPSLAASPAATAFLLLICRFQGKDVPQAFRYLKATANLFEGGIPTVYPIEEFELSFSLTYLSDGGLDIKSPALAPAVSKLKTLWERRKGRGFAHSTHFPLFDCDDSSQACGVLHQAGQPADVLQVMLPFYNGTYFNGYTSHERVPTFSGNINVIHALLFYREIPQVKDMLAQTSAWLASKIPHDDGRDVAPLFIDKWHYSPIYPTSRAIFSFEELNQEVYRRCVRWLVSNQRADGGWGYFGQSTMEETAFAALSLAHCYSRGMKELEQPLRCAQKFFGTPQHLGTATVPLWIGKCVYCPTLVVRAIDLAAQICVLEALGES